MAHLPAAGMSWQTNESDRDTVFSWCEFGADDSGGTMEAFRASDGTWYWSAQLRTGGHVHRAYGVGCANESKARHMAMHLVAALLQIVDGVQPHRVD
jgi:hypothetical protein